MAHALTFLLSAEAATQRMVARKPVFVVHCEMPGKGFEELDAESFEHALNIGFAWVGHGIGGTTTAGIREVRNDGRLKPARRIVDFRDVAGAA